MEKQAINVPQVEEPIKNAVTHIRVYRRTNEKAQRIAAAMNKSVNEYLDMLIEREFTAQEKFITQVETLRDAAIDKLTLQPEKQTA